MSNVQGAAGTLVRPTINDPLTGTAAFMWTWRLCILGLLAIAGGLGGPFVRLTAVAAALFALLGDRAGLVRAALRLVALVLASVLAAMFGKLLGQWASARLGVPLSLAGTLGGGAIGIMTLIILGIIGRTLTKALRRYRYLYVLNRTAGSLFGLAEGSIIVVALWWALNLFGSAIYLSSDSLRISQPQLAQLLGRLNQIRVALLDDPAARLVTRVNPLERIPLVSTVVAAAEISADTELFWQAYDQGCFEEFMAMPVVRRHVDAFRADSAIRRALEEHDVATLLRSGQLANALADDELCAAVAAKWPEARARISDSQIERARSEIGRLDLASQTKVQEALRRAEELNIQVP